jgi:hypothetical protein
MMMVPVFLEEHLQTGTLEYAIHNVVEQGLDLSIFAASCQVHVFYGKRPGSLTDEMMQKSVHLERTYQGQLSMDALLPGSQY